MCLLTINLHTRSNVVRCITNSSQITKLVWRRNQTYYIYNWSCTIKGRKKLILHSAPLLVDAENIKQKNDKKKNPHWRASSSNQCLHSSQNSVTNCTCVEGKSRMSNHKQEQTHGNDFQTQLLEYLDVAKNHNQYGKHACVKKCIADPHLYITISKWHIHFNRANHDEFPAIQTRTHSESFGNRKGKIQTNEVIKWSVVGGRGGSEFWFADISYHLYDYSINDYLLISVCWLPFILHKGEWHIAGIRHNHNAGLLSVKICELFSWFSNWSIIRKLTSHPSPPAGLRAKGPMKHLGRNSSSIRCCFQ